jgi:hypothetical protein
LLDVSALASGNPIHWLDQHSGSMTVLATVVLVLVTAWYVILTRRIAQATVEAQRAYVFVDLVPEMTGRSFVLVVTNDGTRAASHVMLRVASASNPGLTAALNEIECVKSGLAYVAPGRVYRYLGIIPQGSPSVFDAGAGSVRIEISYSDSDRSYTDASHLDLTALNGVQVSSFANPMDGAQRAIERVGERMPRQAIGFRFKAICRYCASEINSGAAKCPACGEWLRPRETVDTPAAEDEEGGSPSS